MAKASTTYKKFSWKKNFRPTDEGRLSQSDLRGCIQKFLDWQPGASTANGTALCH